MEHTIRLSNKSALLLSNILASDGWAKTIADIVLGGSILVDTYKDFKVVEAQGKVCPEWAVKINAWEFTEKQRECCKRAIETLASTGKLPVGAPSYELLKGFGLG